MKLYFPTFLSNINILHCNDVLYFFSKTKSGIILIDHVIKAFLISRGCSTYFTLPSVGNLYGGLDLFGWKFFFSRSGKFLGTISFDNIKTHKSKLKLVLKGFSLDQFFFKLKKLNYLIFEWSVLYGFADFNYDILGDFDVYLYKLLWNWAKRRHPRRPNTWIYSKYWRFFPSSNSWRFSFLDYSLGKCLFLKSHTSYLSNIYCIPISVNIFDFRNYNKIGLNWIKKYKQILSGFSLFLFKLQSGKCMCCNRFFVDTTIGNIKIFKLKSRFNNITQYVLLHNSCQIWFVI